MAARKTKLVINPAFEGVLTTKIRRKNSEVREVKIDLKKDLDYASVLLEAAKLKPGTSKLPVSLEPHRDFLEEINLLIPKEKIPANKTPSIRLTKELLLFTPKKLRQEAQDICLSSKLEIGKDVMLQTGMDRPTRGNEIPPSRNFPFGPNLIWVLDRGPHIWSYFYAPPKLIQQIEGMKKDKSLIRNLDKTTKELLVLARIIVSPQSEKKRLAKWGKALKEAARSIAKYDYAVVREILTPLQLASLRKFSREQESGGHMMVDHYQVKDGRFSLRNDLVCVYTHRQTSSLIRKITGDHIYPSWTYLSAYMEGSELKRHVDQEMCKWNVSMLIDQNKEITVENSWPIYLAFGKKSVEVKMGLGDIVVYSGEKIPHWRPKLQKGLRQTLMLLFFVPLDYNGNIW